MKLTAILLLTAIMSASAGSFAQKITLSEKNAPLQSVLEKIRIQSGFNFIGSYELIRAGKPVSIQVKDATIEQVLALCFKDQNLTYQVEGKMFFVQKKETSVLEVVKDAIDLTFQQDSTIYKGRVLDETGKPLIGAIVRLKGSNKVSVTTAPNGYFERRGGKKDVIVVTYVGYQTQEYALAKHNPNEEIAINMAIGNTDLNEVAVVSNGYQDIPKERATGSFEVITAKQLEHSTSPSLLKRLEGLVTSVDFRNDLTPTTAASNPNDAALKRDASPLANITIRGKNTLNLGSNGFITSNRSGFPLLVIDGIATTGTFDIDQINPEDVETVTVLKDAAAASIWGSRAANGVFVIKTKRGSYNRATNVSFNTSFNVTDVPDLFYSKKMSASDFIDAETFAYNNLYPKPYNASDPSTFIVNPTKNTAQVRISPVFEILNSQKMGTITPENAKTQLDQLRKNDVRNDLYKYLLRKQVFQSYSLGLSGGTQKLAYSLRGGYDNSQNNSVNNNNNRISISFNASLKLVKNLELQANIGYSQQNKQYQPSKSTVNTDYQGYPIYTRLANDDGTPAIIPGKYRPAFDELIKTLYGNNILDMTNKPLEDLNRNYLKQRNQGINLSLNSIYTFSPAFSVNVTYSYNRSLINSKEYYDKDSYYMREMINRFTGSATYSGDPLSGVQPYKKQIPLGGLYMPSTTTGTGNTLRGQLNFNKNWNNKHSLNAIAGIDISQNIFEVTSNSFYGYDPNTLSINTALNFNNYLPTLWPDILRGLSYDIIPYSPSLVSSLTRSIGSFANGGYTYDNRYTLTASIRRDGSNAFAMGVNKSGTPFYSVGAGWNIAGEHFYNFDLIPSLRLRATYGYNGNANPVVYPRPRIAYITKIGLNNLLYANVSSSEATNNNLRAERTGVLNLGLDFSVKGGRLSGGFEYYLKNTKDLITNNELDPSTGFGALLTNTGNLRGEGIDMTLNSQNIKADKFNWGSSFGISYNRTKVTKLYGNAGGQAYRFVSTAYSPYTVGYDINRLFAYPWAGLDPQTGDPRGILNGKIVTISNDQQGSDNANAIGNQPGSDIKFMGSSTPVYFGFFRNTLNYGSLSVSVNILYKLKYFTRRSNADVVSYNSLYRLSRIQGAEFNNRWQKPGDELLTNVPSLIYSTSNNDFRDQFYASSEVNVIKADHIRLHEINFSYALKLSKGWLLKNPSIYANVSNLGIIWRANKLGIDPDINDVPQPRQYSFGFRASF